MAIVYKMCCLHWL